MSNSDTDFFGSTGGSVAPRPSSLLERLASLSQADLSQPEWRRSEARQESAQFTRLQIRKKNGRTCYGRLLNVTADGIGVLCPKSLSMGSRLEIRLSDDHSLMDSFRVVHSTSTVGGFKLGLVLDDEE